MWKMWNRDTVGKELHCEVKHGQMVWVTLNPDPDMTVDQWTAGAFDCIADAVQKNLKCSTIMAIIDTNYKLCMILTVNSITTLCITLTGSVDSTMSILQGRIFPLIMVM